MFVLRAKYLLINPRTVIKNGAVIIKNNKINFAGNFNEIDKSQQQSITDLGNAAIVPGLINAHTHLELTHLDGRIDFTGSFADWISKIIQAKRLGQSRIVLYLFVRVLKSVLKREPQP